MTWRQTCARPCDAVYKLGFGFQYDLARMRASYPHLSSLRSGEYVRQLVDVKQLAFTASANRMSMRIGLATLTKFVLGATLSKAEQCSDWARRPLTAPQLAYAVRASQLLRATLSTAL